MFLENSGSVGNHFKYLGHISILIYFAEAVINTISKCSDVSIMLIRQVEIMGIRSCMITLKTIILKSCLENGVILFNFGNGKCPHRIVSWIVGYYSG